MICEIPAPRVKFYTQRDEASFFVRLQSLPAVTGIQGEGRVIYISVCEEELDYEQVMELIAVFSRYNVGLHNLRVLNTRQFPWLLESDAFWYEEMFGSNV